MDNLETASYAKVNLTLDVSSKRPDGYHDIDSVVLSISVSDRLSLAKAGAGVIDVEVDRADIPAGSGNLVHRAAAAFFSTTGVSAGVRCRLAKRIPAQAGLGGGSGNAAAAIVGLDRLYQTGLDEEELISIAASVGSDVPLFVVGGTLRMKGRGELVEPLPDAPELHMVVAKPDVGVSTAWAYGELDRMADREVSRASDGAEAAIRQHDRTRLVACIANDFDAPVTGAFPEVRAVKELLVSAGAERVLLCGSGSAVLGIYESSRAAEDAALRLRGSVPWAVAARGLTRNEVQ